MKSEFRIPTPLKIKINDCIKNAEELIKASKTILEKLNLPNISYHLAVIA